MRPYKIAQICILIRLLKATLWGAKPSDSTDNALSTSHNNEHSSYKILTNTFKTHTVRNHIFPQIAQNFNIFKKITAK